MAMTPEGRVKQAIKKYLSERGAWFCMPATGGFGASGVPDFLCCKDGRLIAIEAKAPGKRGNTTELQRIQIAAIKNAGGVAVVVDHVDQLKGIL